MSDDDPVHHLPKAELVNLSRAWLQQVIDCWDAMPSYRLCAHELEHALDQIMSVFGGSGVEPELQIAVNRVKQVLKAHYPPLLQEDVDR